METATADAPSRASQMVRIGEERLRAGDLGNARALFLGAFDADNDCADAYQHLGTMVNGAGRYEAAIALAKRAIALKPEDGRPWLSLGHACWRAQRYAEAEEALMQTYRLLPDHHGTHHNLGLLHYSLGRPRQAIHHLELALKLKPDYQACRSDLALAVLKSGDLHTGLRLHEVRWDGLLAKSAVWDCGLPKWEGQALDGKTLLLHHEQGLGDTLQFVRFVPWLKRRFTAPHIVFAAPKALIRLLDGQCDIDDVIEIESPGAIVKAAVKADYHCPLLSAVCAIGATYGDLPAAEPYLRAPRSSPQSARRAFHAPGVKLAIGLVWAASPGHERSRQRSVPIGALLDFGTLPGVRLYSLQVGPYAQELVESGADHLVTDAMSGVTDFADTAAIMEQLDLVITVDSAPVHLAGALGRPAFMFNPFSPCWRWCNGAEPWYSTVRLFNQQRAGDWSAPIAAMKQVILDMLAAKEDQV